MSDNFDHDENTVINPNMIDDSIEETIVSSAIPPPPPVYRTTSYSNGQVGGPPPPVPDYENAARSRRKKRRMKSKNSGGEWAWVILAAAMFGIALVVGFSIFLLLRSSQTRADIIPTAEVVEFLPTPVDARADFSSNIAVGDQLVLPDGSSIELSPWDGESRFTMVLVGLDRRPGQTGLQYRTDTMMIVSIDPVTNSIGVLSLPRDLYVQVPGYSSLQRINSPMVYGESRQPGYGPTLMMQSVQLNMGIRIHDYMAIDFQAFIDFIDAIGGIDVETDYTINDPQYPNMNYGYDPFYLPPGQHHLEGYDALRFARTRHGDSDIRRAERQQQVLYAVRDKILNAEMIPQLILSAPELWASFQDRLYTNLTLEQVIQLGLFVKDIPLENIQMGVIDYRYLQGYTTSSGASVLIPNRARLGNLMVEVFGDNYSQ